METPTHKERRQGDRARATMYSACAKFLQKAGAQSTNPLLFATLAEVAQKDFSLKFDGPVKLDDVCFVRISELERATDVKMSKRGPKNKKKKYELPNSEQVIQTLSREELQADKEHNSEG